jgi:hypothetical protein
MMTLPRKLGITAALIWTMVVTVLRGIRSPNDYAEAQWLLDYRFGFVKRGLIGEILSLASGLLSIHISARLILVLSSTALLIFCVTLTYLSIRLVDKSQWSKESILVSLIFLSSPFMVMSANLNGYYDNMIIVLGVFSIFLLLNGRPWLALCLQALAILVHENSMLLNLPVFCFAWLLTHGKKRQTGNSWQSFLPLLLPILVFFAILICQQIFLSRNFVELYSTHLAQFSFIRDGRRTLAPLWLSTSLRDNFTAQKLKFFPRLFDMGLLGLVLPSTLIMLYFSAKNFHALDLSLESFGLIGICLLPQLLHLVAWDTPRIWTYSILCAFLAVWVYAENLGPRPDPSRYLLVYLIVFVVNIIILTPLNDSLVDRFSLGARLLLYAPVMAGALLVLLDKTKTDTAVI